MAEVVVTRRAELQHPPRSFALEDFVLCVYPGYPVWPGIIKTSHQQHHKDHHTAIFHTDDGPTIFYWIFFPDEDTAGWVREDLLVLYHPTLADVVRRAPTGRFRHEQHRALALAHTIYVARGGTHRVGTAPPSPSQLDRRVLKEMLDVVESSEQLEERPPATVAFFDRQVSLRFDALVLASGARAAPKRNPDSSQAATASPTCVRCTPGQGAHLNKGCDVGASGAGGSGCGAGMLARKEAGGTSSTASTASAELPTQTPTKTLPNLAAQSVQRRKRPISTPDESYRPVKKVARDDSVPQGKVLDILSRKIRMAEALGDLELLRSLHLKQAQLDGENTGLNSHQNNNSEGVGADNDTPRNDNVQDDGFKDTDKTPGSTGNTNSDCCDAPGPEGGNGSEGSCVDNATEENSGPIARRTRSKNTGSKNTQGLPSRLLDGQLPTETSSRVRRTLRPRSA